MALLAALVLLTLSAALATATFSAAHAMRRAALSTRARVRVETGVRRAFAEVLAGWSAAQDTIPIGSGVDVALEAEPAEVGPRLVRSARVDRMAVGLYAVTVDLYAFSRERPIARRRARLWLERAVPAAKSPDVAAGAVAPPVVVTPWAFADLY